MIDATAGSVIVRSRAALALVLVLHVLPFAARPAIIGGDEPHYSLAAMSLAQDRDLDLERDYERVAHQGSTAAGDRVAGAALDHHLRRQNGELIFSHAVGLPVLLAPFYWLQQTICPGAAPDLMVGLLTLVLTFLALLAGRDLVFSLVRNHRQADLLSFGLYFSTPLWYYSRTLFTEPYVWSFGVISIWLMTRNRWMLASVPLGYCFVLKETSALIVLPVLCVVWYRKGPLTGLKLSLFPAAVFAAFVAKNLVLFGEPLVTFQPFRYGDIIAGTLGLLFDPSHGLLPFSPILLAIVFFRSQGERCIATTAAVIFVWYFLVTASWIDWKGGSCFGPRLMVPALPAAGALIVLGWIRFRNRKSYRQLMAFLIVVGFVVQWCAAAGPFRAFWSIPVGTLVTADPLRTVIGAMIGVAIVRALSREPALLE